MVPPGALMLPRIEVATYELKETLAPGSARIWAFSIDLSVIAARRREVGPPSIASRPALTLRLVGLQKRPGQKPGRRKGSGIGAVWRGSGGDKVWQQILVLQHHRRASGHFRICSTELRLKLAKPSEPQCVGSK